MLIPKPARIAAREGRFSLAPGMRIHAPGASSIVDLIRPAIRSRFGFDLRPAEEEASIRLELDPDAREIDPDGYVLSIEPRSLRLRASTRPGLFHGAQTILQLLPDSAREAPDLACCEIADHPRFRWRGLHLDVSRHFFDAERILEAIDWCAMHKLNVLHWHLTDDQGWRLPIESFPRLVEVGSRRLEPDGSVHRGAYALDDIRRVIAHAARRFVEIVPEIEMPGHARAAIAAYPELSCEGEPLPVPSEWGIFDDVLCAGSDSALDFARRVLDEVSGIFPGRFVHIGGDECPKARWAECPRCRARMAAEGIGDLGNLQGWFTSRVGKHLESLGKRMIGWDEILSGGSLPPDAAVMSWRGFRGGIDAVHRGHDVVMSPTDHCYFDYYQGPPESEPPAFPRELPLEKVYAFDPVPPGIDHASRTRILGGQANVWTERIPTWAHLQYMVFPRLCAMAEVLWSPAETRDFDDFVRRLRRQEQRLDALGIRHRPLEPPRA